ncbi:hypothetical protein MMU07_04585 [Aquiflexum sp. LQ15W]|uniref:hypothetical protein n=1 Tax=Cognataquiflexum nitidum TaxID=2922272 RepID=UPI001F140DE6|nr:hypothetical protein [Cognataquiflexum nitidum]MCH6198841.1 hypothetical protein [Cognataquiflexum nitidum]
MKANLGFIVGMIILFSAITGCHREFRNLNKSVSKTQKTYSATDSIFIANYVLYNTQDHLSFTLENKPIPIDEDSVMQVVWKSFEKLKLPIVSNFETGQNHIDSSFYERLIRIRKIDEEWINVVAGDSCKKLILVPVIYIMNKISFTGYISSGGMAGSSGYHVMSFVNLIVFIVKDDDVVYSQQVRHTSERTWANSREEAEAIPPAPLVTKEHWDKLVRLAMKDYIKRMK